MSYLDCITRPNKYSNQILKFEMDNAFCLPLINTILKYWVACANCFDCNDDDDEDEDDHDDMTYIYRTWRAFLKSPVNLRAR